MQAQVLPFGNVWPSSYYNQCPVHLLSSLGSIVSRLYGRGFSSYRYQTSPFSPAGRPLGAGFVGYQTTTSGSQYNPQCPWPLITGMISQIQEDVNALQASQQGGGVANNPFAFPSSVARGIPPAFAGRGVFPAVGRSPAPFGFASLGSSPAPFGGAFLGPSPVPFGGAPLGRSPAPFADASQGNSPNPFVGAPLGRSPAPFGGSAMEGSPSPQVGEDVTGGSSYRGGSIGGPLFRGTALQFGASALSGSYYGGVTNGGSPFTVASSPFVGAAMRSFRPSTALGLSQNFPGVGAVSRFQRKK